MGRPNQVDERLDALLDGRPGEVTDDLAPLLAAAEALRAELADLELDPEVANRHLEQALDRPAPVVTLPVRKAGGGLRRRVAAVALAAALVLVPATMASASALPGQALYPVKLAVEQVRLATVQWSAALEAQVRTRVAARRLQELDRLVKRRMFQQVPSAIRRLDRAVVAARAAVEDAVEEGVDSELVAVARRLTEVQEAQRGELVELTRMVNELPPANRVAIKLAVQQSPVIALPPVLTNSPPAATVAPNPTGSAATGGPPATEARPATTSGPPPTPQESTTTTPTTTVPTTTVPTTTTTEAPPGSGDSKGGSTKSKGGGTKGAGFDATPGSNGSESGTSPSTPSTGP
jgi:Domain of unknown function (DUF5667)